MSLCVSVIVRHLVCLFVLSAFTEAMAQSTVRVPADQPTVQGAINVAGSGDTILVSPGTYYENIDFKGKSLTLTSSGGAAVTTLDGSSAGPVVTITGPNYPTQTLKGFTIQNGGVTSNGLQGAIVISQSSPLISNNIITKGFCAGITSSNASPQILNNQINQTQTSGCAPGEGMGSAIRVTGVLNPTEAYIGGNVIEFNTASTAAADSGGGAAINVTNSQFPVIYNNTIRYNSTTGYGGALYVASTFQVYFVNNLVYGNQGLSGGVHIVVPGSSVGNMAGVLANNTIAGNAATSTGPEATSDVYIAGNLSQYAITNNIIVGYPNGQAAFDCGTAYAGQMLTPLVFDHNDIYSVSGSSNTPISGTCPSPAGTVGNISVDPQFVRASAAAISAGTANFHVPSGSPTVDAGNNSGVFYVSGGGGPLDLDGVARIQNSTGKAYAITDMGAYEVSGSQNALNDSLLDATTNYNPAAGVAFSFYADLSGSSISPNGGVVTFYVDGVSIGSSAPSLGPRATLGVPNGLTAGAHSFFASYSGSGIYLPVSSLEQYLLVGTPAPATTTNVNASQNPSAVGQTVMFSAHVTASSGTPTGSVRFTDGGTTLSTQPLDAASNASFLTSSLGAGQHMITATYVPTGTFAGSSGSLIQQVNGLSTSSVLSTSASPSVAGDPVTLNATVTSTSPGTLTGTVTFYDQGSAIGSASLANGSASLRISTLGTGSHSLSCAYSGDATFAPSNCSPVPFQVNDAPTQLKLVASANPTTALTSVTFTAYLTSRGQPNNAGSHFYLDGKLLQGGTSGTGGTTSIQLSLPVGSHTVEAEFAGVVGLGYSSEQLVQIVVPNPTSTLLSATPSSAYQNQSVLFTAVVSTSTGSTQPYGTVVVLDGTNPVASFTFLAAQNSSTASVNIASLAPGVHRLSAVYTPADGNFLTSTSAPLVVTILPQTYTLTLSSPTMSIEAEHHGSFTAVLQSIGGFTSSIQLSCVTPQDVYLTCDISNARPQLEPNASTSSVLTLDTDAVLRFKSSTNPETHDIFDSGTGLTVCLLLPLVGFRRRQLRAAALFYILVCTVTPVGLTGCGDLYPAHTPVGVYDISITANGTSVGAAASVTQTTHLQLAVTP